MASTLDTLLDDAAMLWSMTTGRWRVSHKAKTFGITIEPTAVCNLRCPYCPTTEKRLVREHKHMPMEIFHKIVKVSNPVAAFYVLNIFGEPTLHPSFFEMMDTLKDKTVWFSTNLNYGEETARRIAEYDNAMVICSVDGWDEESYKQYRFGGDFETVKRNLAILAEGRCTPYPQFLLNEENSKYRQDMIDFSRAAGVEEKHIKFGTMEVNFANRFDENKPGVCSAPCESLNFTTDGYLIPCCANVKEELFVEHIDNINTTEELLNGAAIRAVRKQLARDKNHYESCRSCPGGVSYWTKSRNDFVNALKAVRSKIMSR